MSNKLKILCSSLFISSILVACGGAAPKSEIKKCRMDDSDIYVTKKGCTISLPYVNEGEKVTLTCKEGKVVSSIGRINTRETLHCE